MKPEPPPTHYRARVCLQSDRSMHDVTLPAHLTMPLGQTVVTLIDGRYFAVADVITVRGRA